MAKSKAHLLDIELRPSVRRIDPDDVEELAAVIEDPEGRARIARGTLRDRLAVTHIGVVSIDSESVHDIRPHRLLVLERRVRVAGNPLLSHDVLQRLRSVRTDERQKRTGEVGRCGRVVTPRRCVHIHHIGPVLPPLHFGERQLTGDRDALCRQCVRPRLLRGPSRSRAVTRLRTGLTLRGVVTSDLTTRDGEQ